MPGRGRLRACTGEGLLTAETLLARARFELPPGEAPVPDARITLRANPSISLKVTLLRE